MDTSTDYLITTIDNPYNPWNDFDLWYDYDERMGYHTCSYLARVDDESDALSDEENSIEYNRAIDAMIKYDPFGIYAKIKKDDPTPMASTK